MTWWLGQGWNIIQKDGAQEHTFTINADGPFGPIPQLQYIVDLAEWRGQDPRGPGNLRQVVKAIEKLADRVK
jgi:hypothetical protein